MTDEITASIPKTGPPFWMRHLRREVQFLLDLMLLTSAFIFAYLLRFDFLIPNAYLADALVQLPFVLLLQITAIYLAGVYSFVWRYIGMAELRPFVRAAAYSTIPLAFLRLGLPDQFGTWRIPLSIIIMDAVFAFGGLLGLRVLRRAIYERYEKSRRAAASTSAGTKPVLLVGAGRAGVLAVREIDGRGDIDIDPVGFVDDDPVKQGMVIHGTPVLGTTEDIPQLVQDYEIDHVIITIAEADAKTLRRIVESCERIGVRVRTIPGLFELLRGNVSISRFRDVQIEDLLGRQTVKLDKELVQSFLTGKRVMVTGAGGSIGSELCRQLARYGPIQLLLVERAEGALYEIDRGLRRLWPQLNISPFVADVGDGRRMRMIFEEHRPHVILHAAAHKHVPLMEQNPGEAIRNNVIATRTLGEIAGTFQVEAFVMISTDKAVQPSSVMGATKRAAELVVQDLDRRYSSSRFVAVRFGNVMGSAGSVVPLFREQIERGGPVTVTHPDVTRYFMTISEASQLVLEAGAIGQGGEILVLDMGEPIKIVDLAFDMITLSGRKPFEDVPIVFTGLRPGEKLNEELDQKSEELDRTRHPKIFIGQLRARSEGEISNMLRRLEEVLTEARASEVQACLSEVIPEAQLAPPAQIDRPLVPTRKLPPSDDEEILH